MTSLENGTIEISQAGAGIQSTPNLQTDKNPLGLMTDTLTIYLNYLDKQEPCKLSSFLEGSRYRVFSEGNDNQNQIFTGHVRDAKIVIHQIDVARGFYLELWDPKTEQTLYCVAKQAQPCAPLSLCFIDANLGILKNEQDTNFSETTKKSRTIYLTIIPPMQYFNFRIENRINFGAICEQYKINLMPQDQHIIENNLSYFNSSSLSRNVNSCRGPFTENEIQFFKDNGNNVTLFIHGYNVPLGDFGEAFELMVFDSDENPPEVLGFKKTVATFYRDLNEKIPTQYNNLVKDKISKESLNGGGACNWQVMMSQSLNKATNQFANYTKYNSVISIFWQGDPANPLDYIAAVRLAKYPGILLAKVLIPLIDAGIQVNIIAHSLGNLVLMNALNSLGKENKTINHAFMWQAAIPDNAFTVEMPQDPFTAEYYYLPYAHQGSKKFTLLFSEHDNVLGPVPPGNFKSQMEVVYERMEDPCAGVMFGALTAALGLLDLGFLPQASLSIYHFANMAQVPLSQILKGSEQRMDYYNHWQLLHPYNIQGRPLLSDFEDEMDLIKTRHSKAFKALSIAIYFLQNKDVLTKERNKTEEWETIKNNIIDLVTIGIDRNPRYDKSSDIYGDQNSDEMAALLIIIFMTQFDMRAPMGYLGADYEHEKTTKQLYEAEKLSFVDQKLWLFTHGGMRIPSESLMDHVYKNYIIGRYGIHRFGRYKCM